MIALGLAACLIAFAAFAQTSRKARVPGILSPTSGTVQLSANAAGVLSQQLVQEGDQVSAQQTLFVLNTDRVSEGGAATLLLAANLEQRRISLQAERSARIAQTAQRDTALQGRIQSLGREIVQVQQEVSLSQRRVQLAQVTAERYAQMTKERLVSDIQAQNKQEELLDLQARLESVQRSVTTLQREQQSLQAEQQGAQRQLTLDLSQLDRTLSSLAQEQTDNQARKTVVITAPQAGTVTAIHWPKGAALQAGQTIATLVPKGPADKQTTLQATLYAPSRTVGFIQSGQRVWMRYAAYPYQKFGLVQGKVDSVSSTPIAAQDLPIGQSSALLSAAQTNEPLYRIQVTLTKQSITAYGAEHSLKAGMTLDADIVQDTRSVWEWFLEPVFAAKEKTKISSVKL